MTFEVMSYRGFLRGSTCIGRATIKLDGLLKQATVEEIIPVCGSLAIPCPYVHS